MRSKLKYIIPITPVITIFCIVGLVLTPLLSASPNHVPFAIVSLDEGTGSGSSSLNIGEELTKSLVNGTDFSESTGSQNYVNDSDRDNGNKDSSDASPDTLSWTRLSSEKEADQAIADNEYYGVLIIPKDFTSSFAYDKAGVGNAPTVKVILNREKNPTLAATMRTTIEELMMRYGIGVDVQMGNDADMGNGILAPTMSVPMLVLVTTLMSLLVGILAMMLLWPRRMPARKSARFAAAGKQVVYIAVVSAIIAALVTIIQVCFGGVHLPIHVLSYLWLCSFSYMLLIVGLGDMIMPLGSLSGALIFALGMSSSVLAPEMMPDFWHYWVYPWIPQHYMGEGLRRIIFGNTAPIMSDVTPLLIMGAIGAVGLAVACLHPTPDEKRTGIFDRALNSTVDESSGESDQPEAALAANGASAAAQTVAAPSEPPAKISAARSASRTDSAPAGPGPSTKTSN